MATTTTRGHVNRALDFFGRSSIYFGIGRPEAWTNDSSPPNEDIDATALDTVIGYKRALTKYIIRPVEAGETADIQYRTGDWKVVTPEDAIAEGARWIYLDTTIEYDELPLGAYRQVGLFTGLVPADGVPEGRFNLLPEDVADAGMLEVIDNRLPSTRQADQTEKLSLILEF